MFRAFIAVELGDGFQPDKLLDELKSFGRDLKTVEPDNMHATLKFLGDTDENSVDDIRKAMEESVLGTPPIDVEFHGVGVFPNMGYIRVVWAGMNGAEPLVEIAKRLESSLSKLGFKKERPFSPHVTLARVKFLKDKKRMQELLRAHEDDDLGTARIERIVLKKSRLAPAGPTYSDVCEAALK